MMPRPWSVCCVAALAGLLLALGNELAGQTTPATLPAPEVPPAPAAETIKRDQVLEIAHLYYAVEFKVAEQNLFTAEQIPGGRPAYDQPAWVRRLPYAWYGHDDLYEFLKKLADGKGAGDVDTSSGAPYSQGKVAGVECSGYVGECWKLPGRLFTTDIARDALAYPIPWTALAAGDVVNFPRRHVRLVESYPWQGDAEKMLAYESTAGVARGQAKGVVRRVLPDDFRTDFKTGYTPRRYVGISSKPSILSVLAVGRDRVEVRWLGDVGLDAEHAQSGFRVYRSADGHRWERVPGLDERALKLPNQSAVVTGLAANTTYYFRVTAVKSGVESEPSSAYAVRIAALGFPQVLIVDAFDKWFTKPENRRNANHDFVRAYADALGALGVSFETVDNLIITRSADPRDSFVPADYRGIIYLLGDEGSAGLSRDHALNILEQQALADYLEKGGRLLISGSQLHEDFTDEYANLPNLRMNDATFYRRYLKVARSAGEAATRTIASGHGIFARLGRFDVDDGRVSYNVTTPDVIHPDGDAAVCLRYAGGAPAAIQYAGIFSLEDRPAGAGARAQGKLVYLGFPLESVVQADARTALLRHAMQFFNILPADRDD